MTTCRILSTIDFRYLRIGVRTLLSRCATPRDAEINASDRGFALVDSLAALLILSIAIGLALDAGRVALHACAQAKEILAASGVLGELMARAEPNVASVAGGQGLHVAYRPSMTQGPIRLCHRTAIVDQAHSAAGFTAETVGACPPERADGR